MGYGFCDGSGKIVSQNKLFVLTLNRFFCGLQGNAEVTGNLVRCRQLSKLGSFDSKPILLWFATKCRGNRKFCLLPSAVKAEARFRVKTEIRREVSISEQFQSNPANVKKYLLSRL